MYAKYILFLGLVLFTVSSVSFAEDGLDARTSIKVNRAKRRQSMEEKIVDSALQPSGSLKNKGYGKDACAGVDIGNVYTDGNRGPTPRESTVVVTGDVINIPSNKCR
jgi:hypothetical protein